MLRFLKGIIAVCTFLTVLFNISLAADFTSIQLVGNFQGISCEPEDPANDMQLLGGHLWRKLKFINEPNSPDTIFFKFTKDHSYLPTHWGWSGIEGIAKLDYNPPSIAAVLPDSGYYYFCFNDMTFQYWLERPLGNITGVVTSETNHSVPAGTCVSLFDSTYHVIGTHTDMTDSIALFDHLPAAVYHMSAQAPGYRDTLVTNIVLSEMESLQITIRLSPLVSVAIASASCERIEGGILVTWITSCCDPRITFDIYRGIEPRLVTMEKRNTEPIGGKGLYEYFDPCEDPSEDLYYFLVERDSDDPTIYGPIYAPGDRTVIPSALWQNYPNPFNPATTIPYTVGTEGAGKPVRITFFDVAGRRIDAYTLGTKPIGTYSHVWNPEHSMGRRIPSGVYYCKLQIGKESFTRKLVLLR
jgi:hypothetical protein